MNKICILLIALFALSGYMAMTERILILETGGIITEISMMGLDLIGEMDSISTNDFIGHRKQKRKNLTMELTSIKLAEPVLYGRSGHPMSLKLNSKRRTFSPVLKFPT